MVIGDQQQMSNTSAEDVAKGVKMQPTNSAIASANWCSALCHPCSRSPIGSAGRALGTSGKLAPFMAFSTQPSLRHIQRMANLKRMHLLSFMSQLTHAQSHGSRQSKRRMMMGRVRQERRVSLRIARQWAQACPSGMLYLLRESLRGEQHAMHKLISLASPQTKLQQWQQGGGVPLVRQWCSGQMLQSFSTAGSLATLRTMRRFTMSDEVELERSEVLRVFARPQAVLKELVQRKVQQFPFKLYDLLGDHPGETAQMVLATSECLLDSFTRDIIQRFPTAELLCGEELRLLLSVAAEMTATCTFSTELLHATNLRKVLLRAGARRPELAEVALRHASAAAHQALRLVAFQPGELQPKRKMGRPSKRSKEGGGPPEKKRRGGGGAWRCYLQQNYSGQPFTPEILKHASVAYRALDAESKQWYQELGKQGEHKT